MPARRTCTFAVEALNRFECYFLNTMQQLNDYLDEVDHPHVKGMYDTFHANIEEKDPVGAIKTIRPHMVHVHISENDRGTPGKGHVPWDETYKALKKSKYDGWLTIEAFGRRIPALAAATRVWRRLRAHTGGGLQARLPQHEAGLGQGVKPVYVIGTCDTKEAELRYAVERVRAAGAAALLVDISTTPSTAEADVTPEMVARHHPSAPMPCWAMPTAARR